MTLVTPEFLQTKTYSALRDRLALMHGGTIQPGVWDATDFKASQRAAGANLSVDVAQGYALVSANDPGNAGIYHAQNDATVNVPQPTAAHATLPRIDQLILVVNDTTHGGDVTDVPSLQWITGTATGGATLDNRTGVGAALTGSLLLADVLVPAAATTMTTANIRDRRLWARGARYTAVGNNGANITTTSTTPVSMGGGGYDARLECSGAGVDLSFSGEVTNSAAGNAVIVSITMDGAVVVQRQKIVATASAVFDMSIQTTVFPPAGSHLFAVTWNNFAAGTATIFNTGGLVPMVSYREALLPNTNNS